MSLEHIDFNILKNKILKHIEISEDKEKIIFYTECGKKYLMSHVQDCCESVVLEEVHGDIKDLLGAPILQAVESSNSTTENDDPITWTFYNISTIKGSVTLRWLGQSSGYYSDEVDFFEIITDNSDKLIKQCEKIQQSSNNIDEPSLLDIIANSDVTSSYYYQ